MDTDWLDKIKWTDEGLVPVIAQEESTDKVLMLAWMSRESLTLTIKEGKAIYWSRSRQRLWRKGEESGYSQIIKEIRLDCDDDVILVKVTQLGGIACHTGRHNCFFQRLENKKWINIDPILKDPADIYKQ